ncbi:MAG: hypothetical protein CR965_00285 [Paludibacter sp.]|nr:MAG: hypothetical protein CR965_00285 [Paludibacter sp.]
MKIKKIFLMMFFSLFLLPVVSQNRESIPVQEKELFDKAKEYYSQKRYNISYHYFLLFLQKVSHEKATLIEEAEYYLVRNAYKLRNEEAIFQLEDYLKKYPYTPHLDPTLYMLGILSYEENEYQVALNYFNRVIAENLSQKQKEKYYLHLGYTLLKLNKVKDARDIFTYLKKEKTAYMSTALYYAGYCDYLLKDYDKALKNFLSIEDDPQFREIAPYYITQIYFIKKNFQEVNKRGKLLLQRYPQNNNNAEIYRMLGEQAYMSKNYKLAIDNLAKYNQLSSKVTRKDIYYLGTSYLKTGQPKKAIECLSKITTENDEMTENAYLLLGNAFVLINDKNNARMSYQSAIKTNFNSEVREEAMYNYALTTYESELGFGESIRSFQSFIKEFPKSQYINKAYKLLATLYLTSNNVKEAYQSIVKVKFLNRDLRETKQYLEYTLGTEAFMNKKYLTAIKYFSLGKQTEPYGKYLSDILYWRAESYYKLKKYNKASRDLMRFFKCKGVVRNKNYVDAFYSLGYAYFSQKKYSKALRCFLDYVKSEKNIHKVQYADAKNRIGDIYFYNRNLVLANKYYRESIGSRLGDYSLYRSAYIEGLDKNYNRKISELNNLLEKYPQSEYCDDALYEIGRSYIMLENNTKAIEVYNKLINKYKYSQYVIIAQLEIGLVYFNNKEYEKAVPVFKQIIKKYPDSDEAQTAFETLETIAIETEDVKKHLEYAKKIGRINDDNQKQRTDSILFLTAEKRYLRADYQNAISKLKSYLDENCPEGKFCVTARFYLAESYYQLNKKEEALTEYSLLIENKNSAFLEQSLLKSSEICFDKKRYKVSLKYFKMLNEVAQSSENRNIAEIGVLRSAYLSENDKETLKMAKKILDNSKENREIKDEALLYTAKILLKENKPSEALKALRKIDIDTRTVIGAEAKYLVAKTYYALQMLDKSKNEIMDYAKIGTSHPYWLAKSFILLSDCLIFMYRRVMIFKQNNIF